MGLSADDSILMVVPMFHVMGWGLPYIGAMNGIKLVLPGMGMDGAALVELIQKEDVTLAFGVPTIWLGLLGYCEENKIKLENVKQTIIGGSAVPYAMIKEFDDFPVYYYSNADAVMGPGNINIDNVFINLR